MQKLLFFVFFLVAFIISSCLPDYSSTDAFSRGQEVYLTHCVSCHGMDGSGNNGTYPSLANRKIDINATNRSIHLITIGSGLMKPIQLEEDEVVDVINFIQNSWGLRNDLITAQNIPD